jgi:protein phosphatase
MLPWSAKAEQLLRDQYAAVGAAARASLRVAVSALEQATATGVDVTALLSRTRSRVANAEAFTAAYRRYCWPTDGLTGVQLAPFQVLATEGATYQERPHVFHLDVADRLVAAAPELIAPTRRLFVDTTDPASAAEGTEWWEELTGAGGEGMVVKPAANLTRASGPSRCASTPSGWKRSTGSRAASRSGASTNACSVCSPSSPSQSIPGCRYSTARPID